MKSKVEVGCVQRPHGFRGELVITASADRESALGYVKSLLIGDTSYSVLNADWMPSGWKLKLEGINSDTQVKPLKGQKVFVEREQLPDPGENEYYLSDLVDCDTLDADTNEVIGKFLGVEAVSGQDRWVVRLNDEVELAVPAVKKFIAKVDPKQKKIWIRQWKELL